MEWKTVKLGETSILFIDGDRGKNYPSGNEFLGRGHCLFLNAGNVTKNGWNFSDTMYISEEKDNLLRNGKLQRGDIVLTTRGTIGNVVLYSDDIPYNHIRINSGMVIIRSNGYCDNRYLYHYLRSDLFFDRVIQFRSGSAQPQIPISTLNKLYISLPPLAIQKRIAAILSSLDAKIENNARINANLEAQAQALYKSWFVDFEPFGGIMPEDWRKGKADDFFEINIGKTPPRKEKEWFSDSPKEKIWVSISDMANCGVFISDSSEYLTSEAVNKFNIIMVPKDSILLSFKLTIGRIAIADEILTTNEAIARFILPKENYREYTYLYLREFNYGLLGSTSSIATAVNSKIIKQMQFVLPTDIILDDFQTLVKPLFDLIKGNQRESSRLASLRDILLPKLMKGEIEV